MLKRKPASMRRKSFGGQNGVGIYWRKRAIPTSVGAEGTDETDQKKLLQDGTEFPKADTAGNSFAAETKEHQGEAKLAISLDDMADEVPIIGWDDDLCRPIYPYRAPPSDECAMLSNDDDNDEQNVGAEEDLSGRSSSNSTTEDSFLVEENTYTDADVDANESTSTHGEPANGEKNSNALFQFPPLTRRRTKTFGSRGKRPRPISLILSQEDRDMDAGESFSSSIDQGPRRVSLESSNSNSSTDEKDSSNIVNESEDSESGSKDGRTRTFGAGKASAAAADKPGQARRSKKQRADESSLKKARDYFEKLDQTQSLTLDTAQSPTISSRVTRTSHKTNLDSPGINRSYRAYTEAIRGCGESGLSPLSIRDYVSSRRIHFENKGEMVDGFLDD
ncbi:unnamed protein product [Pseudo-nitzschia multistriata]|uniref:Uncharacterized protein n=1 Tax=Pseudo-nitzschia multistriata TaxID=183589 RepID=A0A448Z0H9_9STRA|nr:unnamed protein product [Pseudo-nitzschia multistriata]